MSLLTFMESQGPTPAKLTVDEVLDMWRTGVIPDDGEPFELIDGEIVPMAAAKYDPHEHVKGLLIYWLIDSLPRSLFMGVEQWLKLDAVNASEPDLVVYPKTLLPLQVRGPDVMLLIEVADTSLLYDNREKAKRYASYGVRDYWVVDTTRKRTTVHRDPTPNGYASRNTVRPSADLTPLLLPEMRLRLDDLEWRTPYREYE